MAHWVIQENLYGSHSLEKLVSALDRLEIEYTRVKVVPFTTDITPDPMPTGPVMAMGSTSIMNVAKQRGWRPGVFNANMDFASWREHWGEALLNHDARICRFDAVEQWWPEFFLRPSQDTKAFTGQVFTWPEFEDWRKRVAEMGEDGFGYQTQEKRSDQLQGSTIVVCAEPKEIFREWRCFIVDGKVITGSLYKSYGNVCVRPFGWCYDEDIVEFASTMAQKWSPDRAYAMDVASTPNGPKIIEVNQINSAGFYAADVVSLVAVLDGISSCR